MALFNKTIPGDVGSAYLDEVTSQLNRSVGRLTTLARRTHGAALPPNLPMVGLIQDSAMVGTVLGTSTRVNLGYFAEETYVSGVTIGFNTRAGAILNHAADSVALVVGMSPAGVGGTTVASCTDFDPGAAPGANLSVEGGWIPWSDFEAAGGVVTGGDTFVVPAGNALTLVFTLDGASAAVTTVPAASVYGVEVNYSIFKDSVTVDTDFNAVQRNWHKVPR